MYKKQNRQRLDGALVQRGLIDSRERAKTLIEAGGVQVRGRIVTKPSFDVTEDDPIILLDHLKYVGRGGVKLEAALHQFSLDTHGLVVMDVGSSTGGFTDCLLQHGAVRVYAVDVGHEQLAPRIRSDLRVRVFEDTDIRQLELLPELIDLIVVDVSFISLRLVLPSAVRFLKSTGRVIALVKPQFEAGPTAIGSKGVIRSQRVRRKVLLGFLHWVQEQGWTVTGLIRSPITGRTGNIEYLAYLSVSPVETKFDALRVLDELFAGEDGLQRHSKNVFDYLEGGKS